MVLPVLQPAAFQIPENFVAGHIQQRTDQQRTRGAGRVPVQWPRRRHARQPFGTAASEQPHQHGLHLVAAVVPHRDLAEAPLRRHPREEAVAFRARAAFHVALPYPTYPTRDMDFQASGPRAGSIRVSRFAVSGAVQVQLNKMERQRQPCGRAPDELRVLPAPGSANAVFHVGHFQGE